MLDCVSPVPNSKACLHMFAHILNTVDQQAVLQWTQEFVRFRFSQQSSFYPI